MNAQDFLNEAQNMLDYAWNPKELDDTHDIKVEYYLRSQAQAQMATALAIMEQTEAIRANYQMAHQAINDAIQPNSYYATGANQPPPSGLTEAYWDEQQRLADEHQGQQAAEEHDRSQTFRDGRRIYRVGDKVTRADTSVHAGTGEIISIHHDRPGEELTVYFPGDSGLTESLSVWAVDPVEETMP